MSLGILPRLRVAALLGLAVFGMLLVRLHTMQVVQAKVYERRARRRCLVVERPPASRGRIYDCRGRLLVSDEPLYDLVVIPAELRHPKLSVKRLALAVGVPCGRLRERLGRALLRAPLEPLVIRPDLDAARLARATALAEQLSGVSVRTRVCRRYPFGKLAAHVLGYVGQITRRELRGLRSRGYRPGDVVGKQGLEKEYDRLLRGTRAVDYLQIDALGRTVRRYQVRPPVLGMALYLTLDAKLQRVAERALGQTLARLRKEHAGEPSAGAVVVMDVDSGKLLALASLPEYDPRAFARGIKPSEYAALLDDPGRPLVDRAIHSCFSPGSTFKMVTGSAALAQGVCKPNSMFYCSGVYKGFHCIDRAGHGHLSFETAIAYSCDVVFYKLGDRLGIARLDRFARAFGLGRPTGVDLPGEVGGLLPSPAWKNRVLGQPWYDGDTINMSIGQGFLLVTPLQMAVVTAAVANGGRVYRPYLVDHILTANHALFRKLRPRLVRRLPVRKQFLAAIRRGMRGAVLYGTSTAANSRLVAVAGKTGTVESFPNVYNPHGRNHTWFCCFAPFNRPKIAVVVFLEKSGGYGGSVAAPIARKVIDFYFSRGHR